MKYVGMNRTTLAAIAVVVSIVLLFALNNVAFLLAACLAAFYWGAKTMLNLYEAEGVAT